MKSDAMDLDRLKAARSLRPLEAFPIPSDELCARFEALSTPIVNDALREMEHLYQTLPHTIMPLREEMQVAGEVFTIKGTKSLVIKDEMKERAEMLASIPAGSVVVWDTSQDDESAQWGEVMTMAARKRGCRGAVIDGGVRDTHRVLDQTFPIFVKYRSSNGMLGRFRITGWQVPVKIGDVFIYPGDIVFGDIDGVIVVPRNLAYDVLIRGEEIAGSESEIKRWIQEGLSAEEVVDRGGYF
jgi:4-hydroxy-4-methyl-2-oxoglutarate aldolase